MTRVLSATVLAALVLGVVCFLPPNATLLLAVLAAAIAFAEYADLAAAVGARISIVATGAAVAAACVAVAGDEPPLELVCLPRSLWVGVLAIVRGQPGPEVLRDAAAAIFPLIYIGVPLGALAGVRVIGGRDATLLLIATIVVSDSAQYYTGRAFGRRRLAPAISPKQDSRGRARRVDVRHRRHDARRTLRSSAASISGCSWVRRSLSSRSAWPAISSSRC